MANHTTQLFDRILQTMELAGSGSEEPPFEIFHASKKTGRLCANCHKPERGINLMECCPNCKNTYYCNTFCRLGNLRVHYPTCTRVMDGFMAGIDLNSEDTITEEQAKTVYEPLGFTAMDYNPGPWTGASKDIKAPGLDVTVNSPFTRIYTNRWFEGRSEKDCFKLIFDTIRVRTWDDPEMATNCIVDSFGDREEASRMMVRRFLRSAEEKNQLPLWWNDDKEIECIEWGHSEENWKIEERPVTMERLVKRYGTTMIMIQMRIYAERVLGIPKNRYSFGPTLHMLMRTERQALQNSLREAILEEEKNGPQMLG